jgi:hypothetical protein
VRRSVPVAGAVLVLGPLVVLVLLVAPGGRSAPESADPAAGSGSGSPPVVQAQARRLLDRAAAAPAARRTAACSSCPRGPRAARPARWSRSTTSRASAPR